MLPTVDDHFGERYREKGEQEAKRKRKDCYRFGGIGEAHHYDALMRLRPSYSRSAHWPATFAKRSNKISITAAMLNTRSARFRESRQARAGCQDFSPDSRQ